MTLDHLSDSTKQAGDVVSIGLVFATIADWLPGVAALLTIVWTAIRIWETTTVQRLVGGNRSDRRQD